MIILVILIFKFFHISKTYDYIGNTYILDIRLTFYISKTNI